MKCPKCGYLGFETTDRCRNCGYDFSLASVSSAPRELSLRGASEQEAPLADFNLTGVVTPRPEEIPSVFDMSTDTPQPTPPPSHLAPADAAPDPQPFLTAPRPAPPPLAVRRATPELQRARSRPTPRRIEEPTLNLEAPADDDAAVKGARGIPNTAGAGSRVGAALIDLLLLLAIDAAVVFLTLRITGLSMTRDDLAVLSPVPLGGFFVLLALGYLIGFTAGGGQTIGKMALGLRVVSDDGTNVDVAGAVLRSVATLGTVATLGLLYVPVLFTADRRALHDRLAGTRVVEDR